MTIQAPSEGSLDFSVDGIQKTLVFSDILYVQSSKNYIQIVDTDGNAMRTRMTFSKVHSILAEDNRFLQINRGIIVNMDCITDFEKDTCTLKDSYSLPINLREQKKLNQIRKNYVFSKLHNRRNTGGTLS